MSTEVIDANAFLSQLRQQVPEVGPIVDAHVQENEGELLLHLLLSDLLRELVNVFESGRVDLAKRILTVVDNGLVAGDDYVQNAVAVSFVEDFGQHEGEVLELLALWPLDLRAELGRQQ